MRSCEIVKKLRLRVFCGWCPTQMRCNLDRVEKFATCSRRASVGIHRTIRRILSCIFRCICVFFILFPTEVADVDH